MIWWTLHRCHLLDNKVVWEIDRQTDMSLPQVCLCQSTNYATGIKATIHVNAIKSDPYTTAYIAFYRRDNTYDPVSASVCHKSVFHRNGWTDRADLWHRDFLWPVLHYLSWKFGYLQNIKILKVKVARTRLPSVGFRSWSRFLAVSLQVTWVINPAVGCHYFPPGLQLPHPPATLQLTPLLGEQRHNGCEQFV